ncbi:putative MFS-type transporter YxiO [Cerasicoccus arenae]|uniref:Putative MFS-type transporter YxiO n=2 Tax=Cerasicoccus arenae TaxID=424488 RepID=A0A8J3DE51_9BACT|nr:putative MFS-type transporter YxiO [Cerasicoccus arenae]
MKQTISWAFYDWANTGYAMVVLALIFPRLYKGFYAAGLSDGDQTAWFGRTVSIASLLVAICAPFLGSIGELGGLRKRLLLMFCSVGVVTTAGCYFIGKGDYEMASLIYIIGTVSFYSSNIFFDSMLTTVSTPEKRHFVSGLGFSFGYAAGFVLLLITLLVTKVAAAQVMFLVAAVWWAVFTIPLAMNIKEKPRPDRPPFFVMAWMGAKDTLSTLKEIWAIKPILWFLAAYLFYIDGVNTIIMMASNYGTTIGFAEDQITQAFFIVQIFGVPCAILFGWAGQKVGPRKMMFVAIVLYVGVTAYGAFLDTKPIQVFGIDISEMFVLAALIGMVQGGIQALSRSYFNTLIPVGREVSFFGFYSMIGKSAAVMGPFLMAYVASAYNNPENPTFSTRLGMGSVSILFVIGAVFLVLAGHYDKRMQRWEAKTRV